MRATAASGDKLAGASIASLLVRERACGTDITYNLTKTTIHTYQRTCFQLLANNVAHCSNLLFGRYDSKLGVVVANCLRLEAQDNPLVNQIAA